MHEGVHHSIIMYSSQKTTDCPNDMEKSLNYDASF